MLKDITKITLEQEENSLNIIQSIDGIATVAEETSASTEESAAAAEEQAASMESITSISQQLLILSSKMKSQFTQEDLTVENEELNVNSMEKSHSLPESSGFRNKANTSSLNSIKRLKNLSSQKRITPSKPQKQKKSPIKAKNEILSKEDPIQNKNQRDSILDDKIEETIAKTLKFNEDENSF